MNLFLQLKHTRDEEWISLTYDQVRSEIDKANEKRAKDSHIFKSPINEFSTQRGQSKNKESAPNSTATGSFVPTSREAQSTAAGTSGSGWQPPERQERME